MTREFNQVGLENVRICIAPEGVRAGVVMAFLVRMLVDAREAAGLMTQIMLAVGRQQYPFFEKVVQMYNAGWTVIGLLFFCTQDDWKIAPNHRNSLRATVKERLLKPLGVKPWQCRFPSVANILRYPEILLKRGGVHIGLFGIGADGHFAFAFKGAENCLGRPARMLVDMASRLSNLALFGGVLKRVPEEVVTIRFGTIEDAENVILIMESVDYWNAAEQALFGPVSVDCPCSLFRALSPGKATIIIGWELAAELRRRGYELVDQTPAEVKEMLRQAA